jgi:secondary thiamine-phosphate synthase enzyme
VAGRSPPQPPSVLSQAQTSITVRTLGRSFHDVTAAVASWLEAAGAGDGLVTILVRHTSASLTIQENTDPDVQADLSDALSRLAPDDAHYRHSLEGRDDMPAHVKAMLSGVNASIPVAGGHMLLGTWQALYLIEHRARPHRRELAVHYIGTMSPAMPDE